MINDLFDQSSLPILEQVVNFTQARHGVLAGNIANLDTPGYLARDLSPEAFQDRLKVAIERQRTPAASTQSQYRSGASSSTAPESRSQEFAKVKQEYRSILRHDGNNGGLEEQVAEIAKNQQQHNMAISLMNAQFRLLRAAVTERA